MRLNTMSRDLHEFVEELEDKYNCRISFITWGCYYDDDGELIRDEDSRFINMEYRTNEAKGEGV